MRGIPETYALPPRRPGMAGLLLTAPTLVLAQASPFMTGATALQTNILILRCSGSEHGGTSQFASRLIGEREVVRRQISRARDREQWFAARGARRSTSVSQLHVTEAAVLPSELEQLPDFAGYLKTAASPVWLRVRVRRGG
jgi:Type IV secretion-system coupling protein DNA-binding domain